MKSEPSIDSFFNLGKAIKAYGFKIDEKDDGHCIAYGYKYGDYGEIWIEFNQSFLNNYPIDMRVLHHYTENYIPQQETLFVGVAPTNQHDFDMLMQLLFPSEDFVRKIEVSIDERQRLSAFDNSIPE